MNKTINKLKRSTESGKAVSEANGSGNPASLLRTLYRTFNKAYCVPRGRGRATDWKHILSLYERK